MIVGLRAELVVDAVQTDLSTVNWRFTRSSESAAPLPR
jgi:hypothetical protein